MTHIFPLILCKVEQTKRMKLKNIDVYVSSTRICVHNLPTNVTDDRLRKLLRQIVDEPSVRITEVCCVLILVGQTALLDLMTF